MDLTSQNIGGAIKAPSLDQTTGVRCEKCGNGVFLPALMLRRVSRLLIGAQSDGIIPINVFSCSKCGHVNSEFIPEGIDVESEEKTPVLS